MHVVLYAIYYNSSIDKPWLKRFRARMVYYLTVYLNVMRRMYYY